jgi:hypothetical protein
MEGLNIDIQQLRVENNAWKRIEKTRLIAQLDTLQTENQTLSARAVELEDKLARSGDAHVASQARLQELQDSLHKKELQLVRSRAASTTDAPSARTQNIIVQPVPPAAPGASPPPSEHANSAAEVQRLSIRCVELEQSVREKEAERAKAAADALSWEKALTHERELNAKRTSGGGRGNILGGLFG